MAWSFLRQCPPPQARPLAERRARGHTPTGSPPSSYLGHTLEPSPSRELSTHHPGWAWPRAGTTGPHRLIDHMTPVWTAWSMSRYTGGWGLLLAKSFAPGAHMNLLLPPPPQQPLALPGTDLEPASQELVLHLQVVALVDLRLEGLIEDHVSRVVLDVLPAGIAMPGGAPLRANPAMGWGRGASPGPASWLSALRPVINLGCHMSTRMTRARPPAHRQLPSGAQTGHPAFPGLTAPSPAWRPETAHPHLGNCE